LLGPSAAGMTRYTVQKNVERSHVRVDRDLREQDHSPTSHAQRLPLQTMPVAPGALFVSSATTYSSPGPPPSPSVRDRPSSVAARAHKVLVSARYQAKNNDIGTGAPRGADGSAPGVQPHVISTDAMSEPSSSPGVAPAVRSPFPRSTIARHRLHRWYQAAYSQYRLSPMIIVDGPAQSQSMMGSIVRGLSRHAHDISSRIQRVIHAQISRQNSRPSVIPAQPADRAADKRRLLEAEGRLGPRPRRHPGGLVLMTRRKPHGVERVVLA